MRLYVTNDSYPELREMPTRWDRHRTWWRAARSAVRDWRLWGFGLVELALVAGFFAAGVWLRDRVPARAAAASDLAVLLAAHVVCAGLALTWGGDLVRPHLRRASPIARLSCPQCGHLQHDREPPATTVRCAECGTSIPVRVFEPPYAIPARFRALRLGRRGEP